MGSPLGPLLANVFISSIEENLEREGKSPQIETLALSDSCWQSVQTGFIENYAWSSTSFIFLLVILLRRVWPFEDMQYSHVWSTQNTPLTLPSKISLSPRYQTSRRVTWHGSCSPTIQRPSLSRYGEETAKSTGTEPKSTPSSSPCLRAEKSNKIWM